MLFLYQQTNQSMPKPIYVLGTGLSHNGSAVLLKDGKICFAIEKERITRIKHDGGNDNLAIQYCLDAEGISLEDITVVVQCENFTIPKRDFFKGKRLFSDSNQPKIIDISHHLAHAYSAVGTSPFSTCNVIVIDGCGSPLDQFIELHPEQKNTIGASFFQIDEMQCEKDSFYHFDGKQLKPLLKDFSVMSKVAIEKLQMQTTQHSIGGFYSAISKYVFGDMNDVGKLMGLAPYGKSGIYHFDAFEFHSRRLFVKEDWKKQFTNPSKDYNYFKVHFDEYAAIAKWAQEQVEQAVINCIKNRIEQFPHENLCYSGGVALNAVANAKFEDLHLVKNIHIEPAAADNGLALGCAFYGWLEYLKMPKIEHNGSTCFGNNYAKEEVDEAFRILPEGSIKKEFKTEEELLIYCANQLNSGKTIGWFQSGSEFGPRSLGRRSILAHPGIVGMKNHINQNIKFREDFRPFAPAVLKEKVSDYFEAGRNSPYMILVDTTRSEFLEKLQNVTHQDGSARVQTIERSWNPKFYKLVEAFYKASGIAVVLNTSLNRKGMPIVETPTEALQLFRETALDILVVEDTVLEKTIIHK
jgi:carbamoyltransferase